MDDLRTPQNLAIAEPGSLVPADAGDPPLEPESRPAAPGDDDESPGFSSAFARVEAAIATGLAGLLCELRENAALDRFREEQINRLHAELQGYKDDLVSRSARQLIQGLVRLHDALARSTAALREKPREELTPETLFRQLAEFQDDIELLLGQHGVERFEVIGEDFDPRRQTAALTVPTDDPGLVGRIARRVRPGFEQGETLLQKERVAVYVASKP